MKSKTVDATHVLEALRTACERAGGQRPWARSHGLSSSNVNNVLAGRRALSEQILRPLGYRRITLFEVSE